MNYKVLSNLELVSVARSLAQKEKEATLEVITIIREVDRRRLYLELGFSSLFAFVTQELKFDESAALRRINAARLLKDMPEVEEKVLSGALSLSALNYAQQFFRKEEGLNNKVSLEKKKAVLNSLENKSTREAQKTLLSLSPVKSNFHESQKIVSQDLTEIKIQIDEELYNKLKRLKELLSHKNPNMTYAELLSELSDIALKKLDPTPKALKAQGVTHTPQESVLRTTLSESPATPPVAQKTNTSRYLPASVRHHVWLRDQGRCTFKDPLTGRVCQSNFKVQFHHMIAFALGGTNSADNITLHCSEHNFYQAVKDFGASKMGEFRKHLWL